MNHTKNYHLPQWSEDDLILMEDFNQMNRDIEAGIDGAKAEAQAASDEAIAIANSAKVTANSARDIANTALNSLPYVVGSYAGTNTEQSIDLGFRPRFLIISGVRESNDVNVVMQYPGSIAITAGTGPISNRCRFTDTGFTVYPRGAAYADYPSLSSLGILYDYIAFK